MKMWVFSKWKVNVNYIQYWIWLNWERDWNNVNFWLCVLPRYLSGREELSTFGKQRSHTLNVLLYYKSMFSIIPASSNLSIIRESLCSQLFHAFWWAQRNVCVKLCQDKKCFHHSVSSCPSPVTYCLFLPEAATDLFSIMGNEYFNSPKWIIGFVIILSDFFCSERCFWDSSMSLCVSVGHSFRFQNGISLYDHAFTYLTLINGCLTCFRLNLSWLKSLEQEC